MKEQLNKTLNFYALPILKFFHIDLGTFNCFIINYLLILFIYKILIEVLCMNKNQIKKPTFKENVDSFVTQTSKVNRFLCFKGIEVSG